ncbi:CsbD family protein [Actinomycetospora sp. CA-101289]|uniref:CsbD family protein n=1 Tax=Actinomycetospora sp. CA-101289 TaxID=3239893 RepID=UPI003D9982D8
MAADDKIDNKTDKLKGKVKETAGTVNNDDELRAEGKKDQSKGDIKQAGEKVKDAFKK